MAVLRLKPVRDRLVSIMSAMQAQGGQSGAIGTYIPHDMLFRLQTVNTHSEHEMHGFQLPAYPQVAGCNIIVVLYR
jgi:hypothetical protein